MVLRVFDAPFLETWLDSQGVSSCPGTRAAWPGWAMQEQHLPGLSRPACSRLSPGAPRKALIFPKCAWAGVGRVSGKENGAPVGGTFLQALASQEKSL